MRSSVGERYSDTVEVGGSIPPAPTKAKEGKAPPSFYFLTCITDTIIVLPNKRIAPIHWVVVNTSPSKT